MRTFHLTWFSFFVCFFCWFALAPLMPIIRDELKLSKEQIGNIMIASISITVIARLILGHVCDKFGARRTYSGLLILGAIPVMGIGFSTGYESFLFWKVLIGAIGASFVLTQYHTSTMFAPNIVGTANATTAGWGNLGGGATQIIMPLVFALFVGLGFSSFWSWRLAMIIPGLAMILCGVLYFKYTKDTPLGNREDLKVDLQQKTTAPTETKLTSVLRDSRVWILSLLYGASFGIELTVNSTAALYFTDKFHLDLKTAGIVAGLHGMMNIFARVLGGVLADKFGLHFGLRGRVLFLSATIFLEGVAIVIFSNMNELTMSIITLLIFTLFVQMACGATYSVVPFVKKKRLGLVSGIVGAGGNIGAIVAAFLFRAENISSESAFGILGISVIVCSLLGLAIRFSPYAEAKEKQLIQRARGHRNDIPAASQGELALN